MRAFPHGVQSENLKVQLASSGDGVSATATGSGVAVLVFKVKLAGPAQLLIDNSGAIAILSNRTSSGHARHIERRQLHLRELKEKKLVDISFVPTAKNVSDILTKALDPVRFEMLRSSFMHYVP